jgi:predicted lipase
MISIYAGVAGFILISFLIGILGYAVGRYVTIKKTNEKIVKLTKAALSEIEKVHKNYMDIFSIDFKDAPRKQPTTKKPNNLKIIRFDKEDK